MFEHLKRLTARIIAIMRRGSPPGSPGDPYAWRPVPRKPKPTQRSGAVAVEEPKENKKAKELRN
jgi:hypothetical protein